MAAAVERLLRAREQNEPLVIFGDYDVDGVTSTALLLEVLRALGWKADFYLPQPHGRRLRPERRRRGKLPEKISRHAAARRGLRLDRRGNHSLAPRTRRGRHCSGPPSGFQSRAGSRCPGQSAIAASRAECRESSAAKRDCPVDPSTLTLHRTLFRRPRLQTRPCAGQTRTRNRPARRGGI